MIEFYKLLFLGIIGYLLCSCRTSPQTDKQFTNSKEGNKYKLRLNPPNASALKYIIHNETETKMEVDGKKISNGSKTSITVNYVIHKDSSGDFDMSINYEKVHLYTKSGDVETEMDAGNATYSINPAERMLGILKNTQIDAVVSPIGEVKMVKGYKEIGARLLAEVTNANQTTKAAMQTQWDKVIGEGMIKKNLKDLFSFFPDSTVRVGDKWKIYSNQTTDIPMDIVTTYRLKEIEEGIAYLDIHSDLSSKPRPTNYIGAEVTVDMKGEQNGEYQMDLNTGMLISCKSKSNIEGNIQAMGKEIPVSVSMKMNMEKL